jgi:hypothetical protein
MNDCPVPASVRVAVAHVRAPRAVAAGLAVGATGPVSGEPSPTDGVSAATEVASGVAIDVGMPAGAVAEGAGLGGLEPVHPSNATAMTARITARVDDRTPTCGELRRE